MDYTTDGEYILAGGNSKYICLYDIRHRILLKKFEVSTNRSLDGILEKLNSKNIKGNIYIYNVSYNFYYIFFNNNNLDGINKNEIENNSDTSDYEERKDKSLPGSKTYDISKRKAKIRVETR